MADILNPVLVLGGLGLGFGVLLSVSSIIFAVKVDPKIDEVRSVLPGANCGACGFPGCDGLARAIVEGKAPVNGCIVGGNPVAEKVANIMGAKAENIEKKVATVLCQGDCSKAKEKGVYRGIKDCRAANILQGGSKACSYGCLGCGTCKDVCQFDAIEMRNGVAFVNKDKCTACMKCIEVCPKKIIELVPYDNHYVVKCKSNDPGKVVRSKCSIGCIGCQICVKNCPTQAIGFENYLAKIDYSKCINCGTCAEKCPTKAIYDDTAKEKEVAV
ncbi:MAG TPA: RnfABCDGE type electron transport complex subunit B [Tissierellaceae bacterium]